MHTLHENGARCAYARWFAQEQHSCVQIVDGYLRFDMPPGSGEDVTCMLKCWADGHISYERLIRELNGRLETFLPPPPTMRGTTKKR